MKREPLDSLEYESTYLELRPTRERLSNATGAPIPARAHANEQVDDDAAPYDIAPTDGGIAAPGRRRPPAPPPDPSQSEQWTSPCRPRSSTALRSILLVAVSASVGIVTDLDLRASRAVFVSLTGVLLLGWARLAWRGMPRAEPFGATVTRVIDRLVTALGTLFAIALWAKYAPHASAAFSRAVVLALCGVAPIGGLLAATRQQ